MTLQEIYADLSKQGFGTDKGSVHSYLPVYEELFAPYRNGSILEIGVFKGDSLRLWDRHFSSVTGIDLCDRPLGMADLRPMLDDYDIVLMNALDRDAVERNFGDVRFDVIIEDSSHAIEEQVAIYQNFRDKLAPEGVYVIEDVQDIDDSREVFEGIDPQRSVEILDRRHIKGRYDDVLVVIR